MKKLLMAILIVSILTNLSAKDLAIKEGAKIEITTRTSYGISLDNPDQQGLALDFTNLKLTYNMFNGGAISNKIVTNEPIGFMKFELGGMDLVWATNDGYNADDNNPGEDTNLGWNSADTGYTYPVYIERFTSGILWQDWLLQLAGGGDAPENWRPWSRNEGSYATSEIINRWAYMETRLQYRRKPVPEYLSTLETNPSARPSEDVYWADGDKSQIEDLYLAPGGTTIGLALNKPDFSLMVKYATENEWTKKPTTEDEKNGTAIGLDTSFIPTSIPGFRSFASITKELNYGKNDTPQPFAVGGKIMYKIPIMGEFAIEPYLGYELLLFDNNDIDHSNAQEVAGGFTIHWPGAGGWQWDALQQRNGVLFPGLTLAWIMLDTDLDSSINDPRHNLRLTLFEESNGFGLSPFIGAEVSVEYKNFTNSSESDLLFTTYLDYDITGVGKGIITPWTKVLYDNLGLEAGHKRINNLKIDAGIKLTRFIKNATLGLTYQSKNLTAEVKDTEDHDLTWGYYGLGFTQLWVEIKL